ncbi:MAG: GspE/PulE family protein, partial [Candidatus Binatia bacterium]
MEGHMSSRLGEFLVKRAVITPDQLAAATSHQKQHGGALTATLIQLGFVTETDLTTYLHREYRLPVVDPQAIEPTPEALQMIPPSLARKHEMLPISRTGSTLTIAMADPSNLMAISETKFITGCDIRVVLAPTRAIQKALEKFYNRSAQAYEDALGQLRSDGLEIVRDDQAVDLAELQRATEEAPLVKLVNAVMSDAVEKRASDIHIEPYEKDMRIRFRIDGMLYDVMEPPPRFKAALVSRIKIMSTLDIAERRLPQDGALKLRMASGKEVNFRVSVLPTVFGEKIVLRLLDKSNLQLDLAQLGFDGSSLEKFRKAIERPYG